MGTRVPACPVLAKPGCCALTARGRKRGPGSHSPRPLRTGSRASEISPAPNPAALGTLSSAAPTRGRPCSCPQRQQLWDGIRYRCSHNAKWDSEAALVPAQAADPFQAFFQRVISPPSHPFISTGLRTTSPRPCLPPCPTHYCQGKVNNSEDNRPWPKVIFKILPCIQDWLLVSDGTLDRVPGESTRVRSL